MNKKIRSLLAIFTIPLLLLASCSRTEKQPNYTYVDSAPESAESVLTRARGLGSCAYLEGKVHLTAVFVSDSASSWKSQEKEAACGNLRRALDEISREAEKYSVELSLSLSILESKIQTVAPAEPDYYGWLGEALKSAGLGSISDADKKLRSEYSADSAPIVFMFNREGRAYASVASDSQLEYCVAYTAEEDSLVHEILHLYGAQDLYYPEELARLSAEMLGESCMNRKTGIDSFTAYLIGWTEEPSSEAEALFDSLTLTEKDIRKALEAETYTGFGTREFGHGRYTGELVFGVADGRGKMTYDEGHVYDGEWKENLPHGTGTMSWANGDSYMGEWKKGKRDGTGAYTWADGSVYVGGYKDDKMHGKGTLTYSDGRVVSGTWSMGELEGA